MSLIRICLRNWVVIQDHAIRFAIRNDGLCNSHADANEKNKSM